MRHFTNIVNLSFFIALLCLLPQAYAISFPKSVNYLKLELTQYGEIEIRRAENSRIKRIEVLTYIPQEDSRQKVDILEAIPSSYEIVKDEYGNKQIKLIWIYPEGNVLSYRIKSKVEISSRHVFDIYNETFLKETELTKPSKEILEKALEFRGKDLNTLADIAIWIKENIIYDKNLEEAVKSSEWVFENKKGTCDEFSNLFISLARAKGFASRYVAGLVYSERFYPHAWAEAFTENKWIPFDPTWLEASYLDATHLKLAILPDAKFEESLFVEGYNVDVIWKEHSKYEAKILDEKEEAPIEVQTKIINEEIGLQGYTIFNARIEPRECLISSLSLEGCVYDSSKSFEIFEKEKNLFVCSSQDTYWVARGKIIGEGIYSCPLTLNSEFGIFLKENVALNSEKKAVKLEVLPEKIFSISKEEFKVSVKDSEVELYSLYLDEMSSTFLKGKEDFGFISPEDFGSYKIWFIGSDGSGKALDLEVIKQKLVNISNVEIPKNVTQKEWLSINVSLKSLADKKLEGNLTLISEESVSIPIELNPYQEKVEIFNTGFENSGLKEIKIILDVKEDYDVNFFELNVIPIKERITFFESILKFIKNLIDLAISFLGLRK